MPEKKDKKEKKEKKDKKDKRDKREKPGKEAKRGGGLFACCKAEPEVEEFDRKEPKTKTKKKDAPETEHTQVRSARNCRGSKADAFSKYQVGPDTTRAEEPPATTTRSLATMDLGSVQKNPNRPQSTMLNFGSSNEALDVVEMSDTAGSDQLPGSM